MDERVELIIPDDFEKNWNITTLSNNIETEFYKDNEDLILTIRLTNVIFNSTLKFSLDSYIVPIPPNKLKKRG